MMNSKPFKYSQISSLLLVTITCFFMLLVCCESRSSDTSSRDTGKLFFSIDYRGMEADQKIQTAVLDCADQGISTVEASVYDPDSLYLVGGGPWDCDAGQGTIPSVPAGSGRKIVIMGKDADEQVVFRGQKSGINVISGTDNNAGTIDCVPFIPRLEAPSDGGTFEDGALNLKWSDVIGATDYRVVISRNSDMTEPIIDVTATASNYIPSDISNVTTYYWQVFAIDINIGTSVGSTIWSFNGSEDFIPRLMTPLDQSVVKADAMELDWYDVGGAKGYRIIVSKNSDLSDPVLDDTITDSFFVPTILSNASTYYWQVFATDSSDKLGEGSEVWSFDAKSWKSISAGGFHTLGIKPGGTLWAWGTNNMGQLGLGVSYSDQSSPVQVGTDSDWAYVTAGYQHTLALKTNGELWVWGANTNFQLGLEDDDNRHTPQQVGMGWVSVAGGHGHTLAINTNGELWAWGRGDDGQLGLGDTAHRSIPTQVGNDTDWAIVSAGGSHSMALKNDGELWVWGFNVDGRLGLGDTADDIIYTPTRVEHSNWASVVSGGAHTIALKPSGELWAWGDNYDGQLGLGDGSASKINRPTWVRPDSDWAMISADYHTVALKTNGELWAWGANPFGQLGLDVAGPTTRRFSPARVGLENDWDVICVGGDHSAALKTNGELWVWGYNKQGQLGLADTDDRHVPTHLNQDTN